MGLTAMDVIASLTLGRGGRHEPHPAGLRYVPSGREPRIVWPTARACPPAAGPHLAPGRVRCAPLALTTDAVARRRRRRPDGRLRFGADVLPLIEAEMDLAYYRTLRARACGDAATAGREFADRAREAGYEALLEECRARWGPTPLGGILSPDTAGRQWADHDAYARWFTGEVAADLGEARAGLGVSPLKEALEVLRDHRDVLRTVVDAPGLDQASLAGFFGDFTATVNRLVIGPQLDRSAELLALVEAGVVRLGPGPRPKVVAPPAGQGPPGSWSPPPCCGPRPPRSTTWCTPTSASPPPTWCPAPARHARGRRPGPHPRLPRRPRARPGGHPRRPGRRPRRPDPAAAVLPGPAHRGLQLLQPLRPPLRACRPAH